MSDIIRLLPDSVANQIAAGEVIQRPSSVIKELVENSIDAGANKIQIIVAEAGKELIQVVDNGKGMSDTDARLAFERHATSKITEAADLFALHTMGFRGEALASIAAVAQVELRTRTKESELGTSIIIEGSQVKCQEPVTCPAGANFRVRNLFFNIPARRKFLKSNQTEMNNILVEFERIALAHPDVEFSLYSRETLLQNLPAGNFKQRILNLFGRKMDAALIPIQVETELVTLTGYIGTPQSSKKKGAHQFFFVNGRYMRHPYFNKAIQSAYERLIADGEHVSYFVNFTVDPARIDVNIHPQKTEIKFQDEQAIWPILLAAVRESLAKFNAVPTLDFDTANRPHIPTFTGDFSHLQPPQIHVNKDFNPFESGHESNDVQGEEKPWREGANDLIGGLSASSSSRGEGEKGKNALSSKRETSIHRSSSGTQGWQQLYDQMLADLSPVPSSPSPAMQSPINVIDTSTSPSLYDNLPEADQAEWTRSDFHCLQYLGRFIVVSSPAGLLLIDQHRAHTRILYGIYKSRLAEHKGLTQGLLFPELLQLSPSASGVLESLFDELSSIGFDLSPLGGGTYSILGIPAGTEGLDPVSLLQSIVDDASQGQVEVKEQIHHLIAHSLARRAAMPIGQALSEAEMVDLVVRLYETENPHFTPDGHLVSVTLPIEKISQMFG